MLDGEIHLNWKWLVLNTFSLSHELDKNINLDDTAIKGNLDK